MLIDGQIRWIVKQRVEGKLKNGEIEYAQGNFCKGGTADIFCIKKNGRLAVLKKIVTTLSAFLSTYSNAKML